MPPIVLGQVYTYVPCKLRSNLLCATQALREPAWGPAVARGRAHLPRPQPSLAPNPAAMWPGPAVAGAPLPQP